MQDSINKKKGRQPSRRTPERPFSKNIVHYLRGEPRAPSKPANSKETAKTIPSARRGAAGSAENGGQAHRAQKKLEPHKASLNWANNNHLVRGGGPFTPERLHHNSWARLPVGGRNTV